MRKVLVIALGALALAGCVHPGGPYRAPAYDYEGYGYSTGHAAAPRRVVVYRPVYVPPSYRLVEHRDHWWDRDPDRDRWRGYHQNRDRHRGGWWRLD
jgi:hypothetical protein